MSTFEITRVCAQCGCEVSAREDLSPLEAFVLHTIEVVWCPRCGAELPISTYKKPPSEYTR